MPVIDTSELNIVLTVLGAFIIGFGVISVKIKQVWYLGEALPAVVFGIILGPIAARFLDATRWGEAITGQVPAITLGVARVMIGVQLVIAGYQLPAKYQQKYWLEMAICLLPVMTIMWICTSACILLTIPKITLLAALVIGSCVTCTDPILSQAIAKGPFSDKFVRRELREIISSEAGANDGFGFPFLMLAVYLIRHADIKNVIFKPGMAAVAEHGAEGGEMAGEMAAEMLQGAMPAVKEATVHLVKRIGVFTEEEVGRLGGGVGTALAEWFVESWLYIIFMSVGIGIVLGYGSLVVIQFALRRKWIDNESLLLWPTALGLFTIGVCGMLGTDDLLACFVAGNALNWNGLFLRETEKRHDEVNSCVDVLLNFGGFMYIGAIMPWREFHMPDVTGVSIGRLIGLGVLVLIFRRIPAIFITYKMMPRVCADWKEALFMGYFGPIGVGAVFYVSHAQGLFPEKGMARTVEEDNLTAVMFPVVMWLVLFSIVGHGLSIPALDLFYKWRKVPPIVEETPAEVMLLSENEALPNNAYRVGNRASVLLNNRFSRPDMTMHPEFLLMQSPKKNYMEIP